MDKNTYDAYLNRIGEWVAENSKDQYLLENMPLCWARFAVVDMILPEIALVMENREEVFLEPDEVVKIINTTLNTKWPKCVLRSYGFMADGERTRRALMEVGAEWILEDLTEQIGILSESASGKLYFEDISDRKLFLYMAVGNRMTMAMTQIEKGEAGRDINCKNL